jgi:hypothetical protein
VHFQWLRNCLLRLLCCPVLDAVIAIGITI